jgi:hypothetical protein
VLTNERRPHEESAAEAAGPATNVPPTWARVVYIVALVAAVVVTVVTEWWSR